MRAESEVELLAPENFAMVETGVYRSSFPRTKNIPFLQRLHLKSVVSLVPEDYPEAMIDFYRLNGTRLFPLGLDGNKWPFKEIDYSALLQVMKVVTDSSNRPLLIHCNKGKHRTGTVVGCLRRVRGWALSSVFSEYLLYAAPKTRLEDQQCIEQFHPAHIRLSAGAEANPVPALLPEPIAKSSGKATEVDETAATVTVAEGLERNQKQ